MKKGALIVCALLILLGLFYFFDKLGNMNDAPTTTERFLDSSVDKEAAKRMTEALLATPTPIPAINININVHQD